MRRARLTHWWPEPTRPAALHLEADFTAEHERGIGALRRDFEMAELDEETAGLERHRVRTLPPDLIWLHKPRSRYAFLRLDPFNRSEPTTKGRHIWFGREDDTLGLWRSDAFLVIARTSAARKNLADLRDAFRDHDAAILLGGGSPGNPFSRPGLTLGIVSRTPPEVYHALREHDLDLLALRRAAEEAGVMERLEVAGVSRRDVHFQWADEARQGVLWWTRLPDSENAGSEWHTTDALLRWADRKERSGSEQDTARAEGRGPSARSGR
jgi:hypothetical protein